MREGKRTATGTMILSLSATSPRLPRQSNPASHGRRGIGPWLRFRLTCEVSGIPRVAQVLHQSFRRSHHSQPVVSVFSGPFLQAMDQLVEFFQRRDSLHSTQQAGRPPVWKYYVHSIAVRNGRRVTARFFRLNAGIGNLLTFQVDAHHLLLPTALRSVADKTHSAFSPGHQLVSGHRSLAYTTVLVGGIAERAFRVPGHWLKKS